MILENFIVFEGIDGAGTSTQLKILSNRPENLHICSEPTTAATGRFLREILGGKIQVDPRTAAFLFAADRAEHVWGKDGIENLLKKHDAVICDRYIFSSLAYQSVSCGEELPLLLNSMFPLPQLLFFFDINPTVSLKRIEGRGVTEIYENQEYLEKTRNAYLKAIQKFQNDPEAQQMQVVTIDATKSKEEISKIIWSHIAKLPIFNK